MPFGSQPPWKLIRMDSSHRAQVEFRTESVPEPLDPHHLLRTWMFPEVPTPNHLILYRLVPRSFEPLLRSGLFKDLEHFNENISAWDTSEVVDMSSMFYGAAAFNMPIGPWAEALVLAPGQWCHVRSRTPT